MASGGFELTSGRNRSFRRTSQQLFLTFFGGAASSLIYFSGNGGAKFSKIFPISEESNHEWTPMNTNLGESRRPPAFAQGFLLCTRLRRDKTAWQADWKRPRMRTTKEKVAHETPATAGRLRIDANEIRTTTRLARRGRPTAWLRRSQKVNHGLRGLTRIRRAQGSTGCQPVFFGSLAEKLLERSARNFLAALGMSSASCRRQQAGSLCSPIILPCKCC